MNAPLLLLFILIPLIGMLFVLTAKQSKSYSSHNVYNVAVWTLFLTNFIILYTFSQLSVEKQGIQIVEKYLWNTFPSIEILFGVDIFAMLLIFGTNLSFFIAEIVLNRQTDRPKTLIATELLFIGLLNGYFVAADIISFYLFFTALSAPLIILISTFSSIRKKNLLTRFSLYNFVGSLLLLTATLMIYNFKGSNIPLNTVGNFNISEKAKYFVWISIFLSFISRLPIWPFHYWISSVNAGLKNPLVFLIGSITPLIGLYGFIRFWPNTIPEAIATYAPYFDIVCIITMVFISLISLSYKDIRYKLVAYTIVFYILYLTAVFLPTDILRLSIGFSLFSFIIILTAISFLIAHIETQKKKLGLTTIHGILCTMPQTSKCLSLFILAGIGLPITPLFWNNFIIISEIFNYHLLMGTLVMFSLLIVALALLEELYKLKDNTYLIPNNLVGVDLSHFQFCIYIGCLVILFFSFFKPLWFVF